VLSFDNFRAVLGSPALRGQYGLDLAPASLATLTADDATAKSFFEDWSRDGQPRLSPMPLGNDSSQFAAPLVSPFAAPLGEPAPQPYAPDYQASPSYAPQPQPAPNPGMRNIVIGFGIAIVGAIITFVTFSASAGGGTYVVAWGAIIFGAIQGVRGVIQLLSNR
jgi:hypothetical protein